jgi:hypothetical protein
MTLHLNNVLAQISFTEMKGKHIKSALEKYMPFGKWFCTFPSNFDNTNLPENDSQNFNVSFNTKFVMIK